MYESRDIKHALRLGVDFFFLVLFSIIISQGYYTQSIKPVLQDFVEGHIALLFVVMFLVFLFCASTLIFIVWWTEWGEKQKVSPVVRYISRLVCPNYYGNYRRSNVYKAIKTCLSKFSKDTLDDAEEEVGRPSQKADPGGNFYRVYKVDPEFFKKTADEQAPVANGVHRTYHANGRLELEATYKNNLLDGLYQTFYEDGKLHQEKYFKNGKLEGVFKAFDEEGILYFDISYKDGKQDGIMNTYFSTGILQYRDMYKAGKHIYRETYSPAGEMLYRHEYRDETPPPKDRGRDKKRPFKNRFSDN